MAENPTGTDIRITHTTLIVLRCFMDQPMVELSGADITRDTKLFTGSLYPILLRLEAAGWLSSRWEQIDPREAGRPRRRYYQITALGQQLANNAFSAIGLSGEKLAWQR